MSRPDNIELLGDPWKLLTQAEKAEAEALAKEDSQAAADLKFAKSLSAMSATDVLGEPPTSDAVFLVELRERLENFKPKPLFQAWTGVRIYLSAITASVLLFAGVYLGGEQGGSPMLVNWTDEATEESLMASNLLWYEGIEDLEELDLLAVANCLDLSEDTDLWNFEYDSDEPVSDQLLDLDAESMDDILNKIESLTFFDNNGYANEG